MAPPRTTHCLRGHPRTAENTRVDRAGLRRCRECDRLRKAKELSTIKAQVAENSARVAALEAELDRLRQQYEADPKNVRLSRLVGEANVRLIQAHYQAAPKPDVVGLVAKPDVILDDQQWVEALPAHCPKCEGRGDHSFEPPLKAFGYTIRYGNRSAKCLLCRAHYDLEVS